MEDAKLQDGMQNKWPAALVAEVVDGYVRKHELDTVLTFDQRGARVYVCFCPVCLLLPPGEGGLASVWPLRTHQLQ